MKKNKILILVLMFIFFGLLFSTIDVSANVNTSSDIYVEGAQVRTSGTAGIRFVGKISESYDKTNVSSYGIAIAFGDVNIDQVVVGNTIGDKAVLNAEATEVDENNNFFITLINIPEDMYGQKVTSRAYIVKSGNTIYSDTVTVRSLGQVTLAIKADKNYVTNELTEQVFNSLQTNYKKTYTDAQGNIFITDSVYETNPEKLEQEFVKDWNNKFGTTWTQVTYSNLQKSAKNGTVPLASDSSNDCSGTNLYAFFKTDSTTSAKWGWLLDYLVAVAPGKVHPMRQINAIKNGGIAEDDGYGGDAKLMKLYSFMHLSASITNFFNGGSSRDANNDIVFNSTTMYFNIIDFNSTVLSINPNLVSVGSNIQLNNYDTKHGYDFKWYEAHDGEYVGEYTMTMDSKILFPIYEPVSYSISYYDVDTKIDALDNIYNIESDTLTLPTYIKEGYAFKGWYTTPTFDAGTQVTEIVTGSIGDKVFYAKMEESEFADVNVTYNLNGGNWFYSSDEELLADFLKDYNATTGRNVTDPDAFWGERNHFYIFYSSSSMLEKWGWIIQYFYDLGTEGKGYHSESQAQYQTILAGNAASVSLSWAVAQNMRGFFKKIKSNNYSTAAAIDFSDANIKDRHWTVLDNISNKNAVLNDSQTLPTPKKPNSTFIGWQSSLDSSVVTTFPSYAVNPGDITYTAIYSAGVAVNANVTFDFNGGATEALYKSNASVLTSLKVSKYNATFWDYTNEPYKTDVFISPASKDPKATFSTRIYIGVNEYTGLYNVISVLSSGTTSVWPDGASYVITISDQYSGTYDDSFAISKVSQGDVVLFDKTISSITSSNVATFSFYDETIANDTITEIITSTSVLPTPSRTGYEFEGWYDESDNKYETAEDFAGKTSITVTAKWTYQDRLIGEFDGNSWVVKGSKIQLNVTYLSGSNGTIAWKSNTPAIATVSSTGTVTGVSEGLAEIVVYDANHPSISFTFYVTVFNEDPTGMLKVLVDSNNSSIYTVENLLIGIVGASPAHYYADLIVGSVSKLLFEGYTVHKDYYLSNPANKSTLSGSGKGGIDFITFHYAADMPYSANYSLKGGSNLASANKSQNANGTQASWHYSTGNDGIWYCQNTAYGAWHAGSSQTMSWHASGVTTSQVGTDIYSTDVTLKSDNYFYIKGVKTNIKNTTGYSYTKFNKMGLGVKLVGSEWYLSGHYYKSSYGFICSVGGNQNTIGIESSVRKGSDLWLTWQYSAQLCAQLLIDYELPLNRLVGHHFFTGKDCPQPLLANNMEIWYEFVEMTRQQMAYYQNYKNYTLDFRTNSSYLKDNGRIKELPLYTECVTYTVDYTVGGTTKSVTLSTILPGQIG